MGEVKEYWFSAYTHQVHFFNEMVTITLKILKEILHFKCPIPPPKKKLTLASNLGL